MNIFRRSQPDWQDNYLKIPFSYSECVESNDSHIEFSLTWPEIVERFAMAFEKHYHDKKSAPLISPCHFACGVRQHGFAINAGMVMLDSDNTLTVNEAANILGRLEVAAIIYTSARNRPEEPRLRLMVPLEHLVSAREYGKVARAIVRVIKSQLPNPDSWKIDQTKFHCGDLFYVLGQYETAKSDDGDMFAPVNEFRSLDGEIWQTQTWIGVSDALRPELTPFRRVTTVASREVRFDPKSKWSPEAHCADKIAEYLSKSDWRQAGLFGLMSSLACSAHFWRYDLSDTELADIAADIQRRNAPHRPYPYRKLLQNAGRLIADAPTYVGQQVRWPERYDTLAEQFVAIAATRIETDDSCARVEAFMGGSN